MASKKMLDLLGQFHRMEKAYQTLCIALGEDYNAVEIEQILGVLITFIDDFKVTVAPLFSLLLFLSELCETASKISNGKSSIHHKQQHNRS